MIVNSDEYDPENPFDAFSCFILSFVCNALIAVILAIITRRWMFAEVSTVKLTLFYLLVKLYITFKLRFRTRTDI